MNARNIWFTWVIFTLICFHAGLNLMKLTDGRNGFGANAAWTNGIILAIILLPRRRLLALIEDGLGWLSKGTSRYARRVTAVVSIFFVITFQSKIHSGFWFPGIGGWVYEKTMTQKRISHQTRFEPPPYLELALVSKNARFLEEGSVYPGNAMFLHFKFGEVLPANYDLFGIVFPQYIFGELYREVRRPGLFYSLLKNKLDERRKNKRFLLPLGFAYPNHAPYMSIDYTDYPSGKDIEAVSFWFIWASRDSASELNIEHAREILRVPVTR